ncbi:MAG: (Fe-S)-binding protein [Bacteroidales bacterium]|nr:(Fe-S)-binding protein [Bacteroidales bacterium]NLK81284.1 (Fe-S)-binding protein [Bacteroidales bacterium]
MNFNFFVLPFTIGFFIIIVVLGVRFTRWIWKLSKIDKLRILHGFFTRRTLRAIREAWNESLLHKNIFKVNPFLGFMHMSLAFGWFLIIVVGHIEMYALTGNLTAMPWESVFFRYFEHTTSHAHAIFAHIMDTLLLLVLGGVGLALYKRVNMKFFGIRRNTQLRVSDKVALYSLWAIFPMRLLAESATAGFYMNGGWLTNNIGHVFQLVNLNSNGELIFWWIYSISLGAFFVVLPFSRYMHIPTEVLYIFLKEYGIKLKREYNSFSEIQVYSCSRCGICIEACQMHHAKISNNQSVYILKNIRDENITERKIYNCLLCGRCETLCPVNLKLNDLRITLRINASKDFNSTYDFLEQPHNTEHAEVVYFAGCMSHLSPSIISAVETILKTTKTPYLFIDKEKGVCCGRPLMLAGQQKAALKLINHNRESIIQSGAQTLITSCPICYKTFKEDYELGQMRILHHSEYIHELLTNKSLKISKSTQKYIYHDPCELGRGSDVYEEPRFILSQTGTLKTIENERQKSLCCGGSLGDVSLSMQERNRITHQTLLQLTKPNPDCIVTACPLCKKTFAKQKKVPVKDIAEIVVECM